MLSDEVEELKIFREKLINQVFEVTQQEDDFLCEIFVSHLSVLRGHQEYFFVALIYALG